MLKETSILVEDFIIPQLSLEEYTNDKPYFLSESAPTGVANYKLDHGAEWFIITAELDDTDGLAKECAASGLMTLIIGSEVFINCRLMHRNNAKEAVLSCVSKLLLAA